MNQRSILAKIKMIEMGIIPAFTSNELVSMINSLPEHEKIKKKRKFRKVWRKMVKNDPGLEQSFICENKNKIPGDRVKRNRSIMVISEIIRSC